MPYPLWTRNSIARAPLPRKPWKFRHSASECWETSGAGKDLIKGKGRCAQCPFRRVGMLTHRKSSRGLPVCISEGTRELQTRRQSGKDLYDPDRFLYRPHIPLTFCFSAEIGIKHLIYMKGLGPCIRDSEKAEKVVGTLSPSNESLRGRKPWTREEEDR